MMKKVHRVVFDMFFDSRIPLFCVLLTATTSFSSPPPDQNVDTQILKQRARELAGRITVLNISVRPGCEDFATLAYLRNEKSASIVSVYVTNGEAGESDDEGLNPNQLAAVRRLEAVDAMRVLDGEARFLNFSDIAAARDTASIRQDWPLDSLKARLASLIERHKPDMILLSKDRFAASRPLWHFLLEQDVKSLIRSADTSSMLHWRTDRFLVEEGPGSRLSVQLPKAGRTGNMHAGTVAAASDKYTSLRVQRLQWKSSAAGTYSISYSARPLRGNTLEAGLPKPPDKAFAGLAQKVKSLVAYLNNPRMKREQALARTSAIMDSIAVPLWYNRGMSDRQRKTLLLWKESLEEIRNTLLGVKVSYRMSDSILSPRQVTFFTIDSISGMSSEGFSELLFPLVDKGWIFNEASTSRLPLQIGAEYRLVSPQSSEFDLPFQDAGLERSEIGHPTFLFIVHKGKSSAQSFVYKIVHPFLYAPRFSVEVLTPIVAMVPGEKLVVRLTNHTRDGVNDSVTVADASVAAAAVPFRINTKGGSHLDTITLGWRDTLGEGTYLFPLEVGGIPVARFAARKFYVNVDRPKSVMIFSGIRNSVLGAAVQRLGVANTANAAPEAEAVPHDTAGVLIVDRRALLFSKDVAGFSEALLKYADDGGHVIMLSQNASVWNATPFSKFLRLHQTDTADAEVSVEHDSSSHWMTVPNTIQKEDFENYVLKRNHNLVNIVADGTAFVKTKSDNPVLVSFRTGKGRLTYVDLEVTSQLANIHSGTYKLLANLISMLPSDFGN